MGKTGDQAVTNVAKATAADTASNGKVINIDDSIKIMFNHVS